MPQPMNDSEFENLLRAFRPIAPAPLLLPQNKKHSRWSAVLALAALVVVAALVSIPSRKSVPPRKLSPPPEQGPLATAPRELPITINQLNQAAARGDDALESALIQSSPHVLPRMDRPNSALQVLARNADH